MGAYRFDLRRLIRGILYLEVIVLALFLKSRPDILRKSSYLFFPGRDVFDKLICQCLNVNFSAAEAPGKVFFLVCLEWC